MAKGGHYKYWEGVMLTLKVNALSSSWEEVAKDQILGKIAVLGYCSARSFR